MVLSAQGDGTGVTLNTTKAVQYRAYKFSIWVILLQILIIIGF
jgi:hypothetical protein